MFLAETSIQLVPDGTLLLHLLMVGIMVAVLNRTLLKPINQTLSEREKQIAGRLKESQAGTRMKEANTREPENSLRELVVNQTIRRAEIFGLEQRLQEINKDHQAHQHPKQIER